MENSKLSRRQFFVIGGAAAAGLVLVGGAGCNKSGGVTCTDTAGLSEQEIATRNQLAYVDKAEDPNKACDACRLFQPKGANQCGGCTVVKGPINPKGSCKAWAQKDG